MAESGTDLASLFMPHIPRFRHFSFFTFHFSFITLLPLKVSKPLPQPVLAVVSVLGKDQKGVVAQFATYMAERGINIEDIEQRVVRGFFVMDMLVDLKDLAADLSELITGLLDLGRRIDMEGRLHLNSE